MLLFNWWLDYTSNILNLSCKLRPGLGLFLFQGTTSVTGYLPKGVWYMLENQTKIESSGDFFDLDAPLDKIPLLARGGSIIPKQQGPTTTTTTKR